MEPEEQEEKPPEQIQEKKEPQKTISFRWLIAAAVILLLIVLILGINPLVLIFAAGSILINALVIKFQLTRGLPINLQFTTFPLVLITAATDLRTGLILAPVYKLAADIYARDFFLDHLAEIAIFAASAAIAHFLSIDITILGLIISVFDAAAMFIFRKFINIPHTSNMLYFVSRFVFNAVLFLGFANVVSLLG